MDLAEIKEWRHLKALCGVSVGDMLNRGMKYMDWLIAEAERLTKENGELRDRAIANAEEAGLQVAVLQSSLTRSKAEGRLEAFEEAAKMIEGRVAVMMATPSVAAPVLEWVESHISDIAAAIRQQAGHSIEEKPEIPAIIFDGAAVYEALNYHGKRRTSPEAVGDVLDAIARLMKK